MRKFCVLLSLGVFCSTSAFGQVTVADKDPCWREKFHWETAGVVVVDPSSKDKLLDDDLFNPVTANGTFRTKSTFGEVVKLLGPAYIPPCSGTGIATWKFKNGKEISFGPDMLKLLNFEIQLVASPDQRKIFVVMITNAITNGATGTANP